MFYIVPKGHFVSKNPIYYYHYLPSCQIFNILLVGYIEFCYQIALQDYVYIVLKGILLAKIYILLSLPSTMPSHLFLYLQISLRYSIQLHQSLHHPLQSLRPELIMQLIHSIVGAQVVIKHNSWYILCFKKITYSKRQICYEQKIN